MSTSQTHRIAGLDLIRGVAVTLVIICHATPRIPWSAGPVGVVMFFTLSGYLITGVLMSDMRRYGRIRYGRFYRNRALRLLPALLFLLAGYAVYALFVPGLRATLPRDLGVGIAYLTDIPGITGSPALQHLWTLATEEQFYLIWPALLALAFILRRFWPVFAAAAVLILGAFTVEWMLGPGDGTVLYMAPWSWAITILIGAAARLLLRTVHLNRAVRIVLLVGATVGIIVYSLLPGAKAWLPFYILIGPGTALFTVALIVVLKDWTVLPTAALKPLLALGVVSYAAYLWDFPLVVAAERMHVGWWFAVVGTLIMATVSWWLVEWPVMRWRAVLDAPHGENPHTAARSTPGAYSGTMQDRPEFDTTEPLDLDDLTDEERAEFEAGMRRLAELREHEDEIADL